MMNITKTVENLTKKDSNMNRHVFWELKRKIDPKKSTKQRCSINNDEGKKEEEIEQIKEVYRK